MKKIMILLIGLLLIACGPSQETLTIQLQEDNLQVIDQQMIFTENGNVKQSTYTQYIFDLSEFKEKVHDLNGDIQLVITKTSVEIMHPNPLSQSPSEGIEIRKHSCTLN